ncbi:hypothetical protein NP233_g11875 [Leucocoprinus birnbaumii]|uniref:Uncharacterized protein n=1 Tax=Leucocoprinus birnbaumii TaxID=56174 RepID=A0AAD5VFP8_9AGAR|nr:hypothetical protein NP233_g11875 [Leucocoprinus birnbaumii]
MANLIRTPKPGIEWTENDLEAYNIHLRLDDADTFSFKQPIPIQPNVDNELLIVQEADGMTSDCNATLVHLIDLAMRPSLSTSAVVDFAVELLKRLGFVKRHRVARTRVEIPILVCGKWHTAKTDVCLVDRLTNEILLIVLEDRRNDPREPSDPLPQLVAAAIAAFDHNKGQRSIEQEDELAMPPAIPGIILSGTTPTFYRIRVTQDLVHHVRHGTFPHDPTNVHFLVPDLPRPTRRSEEYQENGDSLRFMIYGTFYDPAIIRHT